MLLSLLLVVVSGGETAAGVDVLVVHVHIHTDQTYNVLRCFVNLPQYNCTRKQNAEMNAENRFAKGYAQQ